MAKIFKPRRALRSSVKSGSKRTLVLASGELMAVGKTAIGEGSRADIYLGDGVSQIQNLQPALFGDTSEEDMTITDDTSSTATAALGNVTTGATLGSILGSLKRAISLNASAIATLNDENLCTFGRLSEQPSIYVQVACTWSKIGWTELNNILNYIAIPTRNGQYCKCAIVSATGSYRMMCPYVKLSTDINRLYVHFYAADTAITSSSAMVWPLFLS